jgi:hypothetical protein
MYVCMTVLKSHCGFVWCALQYHGGECPFVHQLHDCVGLCSILLRVVWCALQFHGGECPYNDEGLLMTTQACGLFECPPGCRGAGKGKTSLCRVRPLGGAAVPSVCVVWAVSRRKRCCRRRPDVLACLGVACSAHSIVYAQFAQG